MSIIGKKILGSTILQDPKQEWAKINGVCLGESSQYGYITAVSKNIGQLLDRLIKDENVVVVVYNIKNGNAYIKKGCNINDPNDSKINKDYVSFLVKKRLNVNIPANPPVSIPSRGFVTAKDGKFYLDGKEFKFVGPNAYWLGLTEGYSYPEKVQVDEIFEATRRLGGTSIRSHTMGHSSGSQNSLRPMDNNLNNNAWEAIDYAYSLANKYDIKIVAPLTDCYKWYNGGYGNFCETRGIPKRDFWTNMEVRADFKKYIFDYLNHFNKYTQKFIKDDTALGLIELGNELGNIREGHDSTNIPTKDWLQDISSYIKSIDRNHLVLNPADECLGQSDDFSISTLDCHSGHFYWADYNRMNYGAEQCRNVLKPYIVGEYSSFSDEAWYRELEKRDVKGSLFWSLYPHSNGISGGDKIPHEDGYTIHYSSDNERHLLVISNHFRRLRGIPEISSLDFTKSIKPLPETPKPSAPVVNLPETPKPSAPVVNLPKPNVSTRDLNTLLNGRKPIGVYFQSWSSGWASSASSLDLSKISSPTNIVYLSFVKPETTYTTGTNSLSGTGLDFSSDFSVVKDAIKILRDKGIVVMLSVGGATYPFTTYNSSNVAQLAKDLGCNGVDIDWENHNTRTEFGTYIQKTRDALGPNMCVSTAGFSVGAYGEGNFANAPPVSDYRGMNIQGLKSHGKELDWINIMSYDASPAFSSTQAFDAYRSFYNGPLLIGFEPPPEAWGGHILTLDTVKNHCNYVKDKNGGAFVWSYQKQGPPHYQDIANVCFEIFKNSSPTVVPPTPVNSPTVVPPTPVNSPTVVPPTPNIGNSTWVTNFDYKVGNIVSYNGSSYVCIQAHISLPNWAPDVTASLWSKSGTKPSDPVVLPVNNPILNSPSNEWKANTKYELSQTVSYNGFLYTCIQAHTSLVHWTPDYTSSLWSRSGATNMSPVTPTPSASPIGTPIVQPNSATIQQKTIIAPYSYNWSLGNNAYSIPDLKTAMSKINLKAATSAFITGDGGLGLSPSVEANMEDMQAFVKAGNILILSVGGANGPFIQDTMNKDQMVKVLSDLLDRTGSRHLDFDIEGSALPDIQRYTPLNEAIAVLQSKYKGLYVSYTIPVGQPQWGSIEANGMNLLKNAKKAGVDITVVNAMIMDIFSGADWGVLPVKILENMHFQLKSELFQEKTDQQIYKMLGATPMIGTDDMGAVFSVEHARILANYAKEKNIGLVSFWSLQRDQVGTGNLGIYSQQNKINFEYYNTFKSIIG